MSILEPFTFHEGKVYPDEILPLPGPWETMSAIQDANRSLGHHWFTEGAMEFFGTTLVGVGYPGTPGSIHYGRFFFTRESEPDSEHRWTIRAATSRGQVVTVGGFRQFTTLEQAQEALEELLTILNQKGLL